MDNMKVEIERFTDKKGNERFYCSAYGKEGEFKTLAEASEFAEAAESVWRKKHEGS